MEIKNNIPSRIFVQGNPINVFYRNQPRSCFVCGQAGHEAKNCPSKKTARRAERVVPPQELGSSAQARDVCVSSDNRKRQRVAVSDDEEPSFSDIVRGNSTMLPPPPPAPTAPPVAPPAPVIPSQVSEAGDSTGDLPDQSTTTEVSQVESVVVESNSREDVVARVNEPIIEMEVSSGLTLLKQLLEEPPKELVPRPPLMEESESESQWSVPPDIPASVPPDIPESVPPAIPASDPPVNASDVPPSVQEGDDVASQEVDSMDLSSDTALVTRLLESTPKTLLPRPTPPPSPS